MAQHDPKPQRAEPQDVGTLWTLRRDEYTTRCSLLFWSPGWELRVVMERDVLLSRRCSSSADAFELADEWRRNLVEHGWQQIIPMSLHPSSTRDDRRNGTALTF